MITIHLQLLAVVFWIISLLLAGRAIYWVASTAGKPDFEPVLGIALAVRDAVWSILALGIGFLIFMALKCGS